MFYKKEKVDIFDYLEESYCSFHRKGHIYVVGDFNARCGTLDDFISDDKLEKSVEKNLQSFVDYDNNANVYCRHNADRGVNNFGKKLINLCRTTGLKIVNGRNENDYNGNITFYNANGTSTIDYLLTDVYNFDNIAYFSTGIFNCFSDHAPVSFCIKTNYIDGGSKALCCANTSQGNGSINQCTSVRWKEGADLEATWSISEHYDLFLSYVENQLYTQEDVDNCVANFSKTLCKIMKPYCIITGGLANTVIDAERCIDKPWFNDICKSKYRDYRGALHNFNVCKSDVNRIVLCAKKKVYKKNSPEV